MKGFWRNPYARFGLLAVIMVVILLIFFGSASLLWSYLLAINLVTFLVYRYDKQIAGTDMTRVPEIVLLLLTAVGGSPAAFVAMFLLRRRHKAQKRSFQIKYWTIVVVQVLLVLFLLFGR